jgi:hypothetical protein
MVEFGVVTRDLPKAKHSFAMLSFRYYRTSEANELIQIT